MLADTRSRARDQNNGCIRQRCAEAARAAAGSSRTNGVAEIGYATCETPQAPTVSCRSSSFRIQKEPDSGALGGPRSRLSTASLPLTMSIRPTTPLGSVAMIRNGVRGSTANGLVSSASRFSALSVATSSGSGQGMLTPAATSARVRTCSSILSVSRSKLPSGQRPREPEIAPQHTPCGRWPNLTEERRITAPTAPEELHAAHLPAERHREPAR